MGTNYSSGKLRVKAIHKYIHPETKETKYQCLIYHENGSIVTSVLDVYTLVDWAQNVNYIEFINIKPISGTKIHIKELEPIRLEKYFEYTLEYVDYTDFDGSTKGIKGWKLRMLDYLVDINFTCPSIYHEYPVISLENAFCYNSDTQYELMRFLKKQDRVLDLTGLDTSNMMSMESMFGYGTKIRVLNMSNCITPQLIHARNIFSGCVDLEYIYIDNMRIPKHLKLSDIFLPQTDYKRMKEIVVSEQAYNIFKRENYWKRLENGNTPENIKKDTDKAKMLGIEPPIRLNLTVKK